ncbi:8492_t:CDS:2, partial [Entrophospora sp. SA101]
RGQIVSSSTPTTTAVPNSFDHFSDKSTSTSSLLYLNDSYPSYKQQILNPTYSNRFILDKEDEGLDDQCIYVHDITSGTIINKFEGHNGGIRALQYVGKMLVSGSADGTVCVWNLSKGVCTHVFSGHTSTVRCLQIITPQNANPNLNELPVMEPSSPIIVTGSDDSTLKVAQSNDNSYLLHTLQGHNQSVSALAGMGKILASGSYDHTIRIWNTMTAECLWHLQGHTQKIDSVVLDTRRGICVSRSMDGTIKVWSLED